MMRSKFIFLHYDGWNRLTNMVDGLGSTVFNWTMGDQLAGEVGPWASDAVNYTYNGRLRQSLSVQQPTAANWVQTYGYDTVQRLNSISSPAGNFYYTYSSASDLPDSMGISYVYTIGYTYIRRQPTETQTRSV